MVPGLLPVVINTITRHRSILGVQLERALRCQVLHLAGLSLFSHLARAVFGIFLSRASAISPVASPLGGCGTVCTSVVKERSCWCCYIRFACRAFGSRAACRWMNYRTANIECQ